MKYSKRSVFFFQRIRVDAHLRHVPLLFVPSLSLELGQRIGQTTGSEPDDKAVAAAISRSFEGKLRKSLLVLIERCASFLPETGN
jgi:hypothetical protein